MLVFSGRGGRVRFRIDASLADHANVSFFEGGTEAGDIPVHLSLRLTTAKAVTNTRRGGVWAREQDYPLPAGDTVEIEIVPPGRLRPGRVQIWLGATRIAAWRARNAAGLTRIGGLRLDGAVVPRSLEIETPDVPPAPRGHLALRPHGLLVEGWGHDPAALDQDMVLMAEGSERPLRLVRTEAPEGAAREGAVGCLSVIPGWLSSACPNGIALRLLVNGRDTGVRLELDRDELRRRVELVAQNEDVAAQILAAEHSPSLSGLLSPAARWRAARAATRYGLPRARTAPARPAGGAEGGDVALRAVGARVRRGEAPEAALAGVAPMEAAAALRLAVELTDPFAARGHFPALVEWARDRGLAPEDDIEAWRSGAALPWLTAAGRADEAARLLPRLHLAPGGQVTTAALACWLETALEADPDAATALWAALVTRWSQRQGHRLACRHMIRAAHLVMARLRGLEDRAEAEAALITGHGLSAAFWRGAPTGLAEARRAFAAIETGDPGEVEAGIAWFEARQVPGTLALRQDLLGPLGLLPREGESEAAAAARLADPGGAALRRLAHPLGPDEDPALSDLARQGILDRYGRSGLPQAPGGAAQDRAARTARCILAGQAPLEAILADLDTLSGPENVHVGIALGLSLLAGLAKAGREDEAARLEGHLAKRPADDPSRHAAPVRSARDTLSRAPGEVADRALRRFLPEGEIAPILPPRPDALPEADPILDALVCVISCKPNLDTRIPALRAAWLDRLAALGVPVVIVTGGGDGTLRDGVLALDAPDDYEGLPQKSLALAQWVLERTPYAHLVKIDDDCFLDPDAFFHGLSWRKFDYHGRYLRRLPGQTDRLWHARPGRPAEPDRSPEPAAYADGGSTYVLSRRAMAELGRAAQSPQGQVLRLHSMMEDKLVGDLLALAGIGPVEENHVCAIRRRPAPDAHPVPWWENGFFPSRAAPTRQIHLDRPQDQARAAALLSTPTLYPKKLWPAGDLRLRYNSDALELVSPRDRVERAATAPFAVVAALRNEAASLDAFLGHYRRIGAGGFLIADNLSDDGTLERLAEEPDVAVFSVDTDYDAGRFGVTWQRTLAQSFRPGRWTLLADADELLVCEAEGGMAALLSEPAFAQADAARVMMLDLYPKVPLSETELREDPFAAAGYCDTAPFLGDWLGEGPFGSGPTWTSALRHRLLPASPGDTYLAQKFALLRPRPWMRLADGLHHAGDLDLAPRDLLMGHFKYHAGFHAKAHTEATRGRHWDGAREYRAYAALPEGMALWDPELSVPWRDAPQVAHILSGGRLT